MKQPLFLFASLFSLLILSNCAQLEDFDIFPELVDGRWELVEVTLGNADADSCDLDDIIIFEEDGSFERLLGDCRPQEIEDDVTGSWTFRDNGDILLIKERLQLESGLALTARRFQYSLASDTLQLVEELEGGDNSYLYVRE